MYEKDYLYQLRCFVFHEGVPTINEKDVAKKESSNKLNISKFKFSLVLDDSGFYTGAYGYSENSGISNLPSEKRRTVEIAVSAGEICCMICIAAKMYLDENEDKFVNVSNFEVFDKRKVETDKWH